MKRCFKCLAEKPLSEFYVHPEMGDGHLNKCIECTKKDVHNYYRVKTHDPLYIIKERLRGREKHERLYSGKQVVSKDKKKTMEKYFSKYPEKKLATTKVGNAIRDGRLKKQRCAVCGNKNTQAHHEDYSKPLEVIWLCVKHHNEVHVAKRESLLFQNRSQVV